MLLKFNVVKAVRFFKLAISPLTCVAFKFNAVRAVRFFKAEMSPLTCVFGMISEVNNDEYLKSSKFITIKSEPLAFEE